MSSEHIDLSEYLDFEEIRSSVRKLKNWIDIYGPIQEISEAKVREIPIEKIWSELSDDNNVSLHIGILKSADRFFVSNISSNVNDNSYIETALFTDCPVCGNNDDDFDEEENLSCLCEGNGRLFIDLEKLLKNDSNISINIFIEPA